MRKFILVLALFLGVAFVILSFSELQTIVQTLQRANFWFVLIALGIQAVWFFLNIITPTAGLGGIALFASEASRRGHAGGKATVAAALFLLFDEAAFLVVLTLGLFVMFRRNNISAGEITASLLLLALASTIAFFLYLGYRSAEQLGDVLARIAAFINRIARSILHRDYLSEERAHQFAHDIGEGLSGLTQRETSLLQPIGYGLATKGLQMGILTCSFLAFDVPFSAGTIVGGFSIGYLFFIVSPTPSGIGVVEGVMALALASLRVLWSEAVIITLVYRAITFWVPLGVGALAFRRLHRR
jgi:uncharacterized protein (TIRG00374 family)